MPHCCGGAQSIVCVIAGLASEQNAGPYTAGAQLKMSSELMFQWAGQRRHDLRQIQLPCQHLDQ